MRHLYILNWSFICKFIIRYWWLYREMSIVYVIIIITTTIMMIVIVMQQNDAIVIREPGDREDYRKYFQNPSTPIVDYDRNDYKTYYFRDVGTSDYYELLASRFPFVDKSLLIERFLNDPTNLTIITRPRRWGKSTNMKMLKRFFEIEFNRDNGRLIPLGRSRNRKLFLGGQMILERFTKHLQPLNIARLHPRLVQNYLGQSPVIYFSFSTVTGSTYEEIRDNLAGEIEDLYDEHAYLERYCYENDDRLSLTGSEKIRLNSYYIGKYDSDDDVVDGLRFLSRLLYEYYDRKRKVYLFVDEFDKPLTKLLIRSTNNNNNNKFPDESGAFFDRSSDFRKTYRLLKNFINRTVRDNDALEKVLFSGTVRLERADLLDDLLAEEYGITDDGIYNEFYGFKQTEVDELLTNLTLTDKKNAVRDWYYGYHFGANDDSDNDNYYNPWSVLKCLFRNGTFDTYWPHAGNTKFIGDALKTNSTLRSQIRRLIDGGTVRTIVSKRLDYDRDIGRSDKIIDILLSTGYLTVKNVIKINDRLFDGDVFIPNHELKTMFMEKLRKAMK